MVTTIKPIRGQCFAVVAAKEMEEQVGGIYIPESAKARNYPSFKGIIVMVNEDGADLRGLLGMTCLFASWAGHGFKFEYEWEGKTYHYLYKYHLILDEIVAVFDVDDDWMPTQADGESTTPGESGIYRCRFCRSSGQGNLMLDGNLVCPQCGRTPDGKTHHKSKYTLPNGRVVETDLPVGLSDDDEERFGFETPKVRGTKKITYPGMDKKG